jgi:hypothetical protein
VVATTFLASIASVGRLCSAAVAICFRDSAASVGRVCKVVAATSCLASGVLLGFRRKGYYQVFDVLHVTTVTVVF